MTVIFVLLEQLIVLSKVTNLRLVGAVGARDLLSLRLVGAVGAGDLLSLRLVGAVGARNLLSLRLVGAVGARDLLSLRLVGAVGARELCGDLIRKVIDSATGKVEKPGFFAVGSQTNELLQFKAGLIYH